MIAGLEPYAEMKDSGIEGLVCRNRKGLTIRE